MSHRKEPDYSDWVCPDCTDPRCMRTRRVRNGLELPPEEVARRKKAAEKKEKDRKRREKQKREKNLYKNRPKPPQEICDAADLVMKHYRKMLNQRKGYRFPWAIEDVANDCGWSAAFQKKVHEELNRRSAVKRAATAARKKAHKARNPHLYQK